VSVLPEWISAGIGGFVRGHPGFTAFAVLIASATLLVAVSVVPDRDGVLSGESVYVPSTATDHAADRRMPATSRAASLPEATPMGSDPVPRSSPALAAGTELVEAPSRTRLAEATAAGPVATPRAAVPPAVVSEATRSQANPAPPAAAPPVNLAATATKAADRPVAPSPPLSAAPASFAPALAPAIATAPSVPAVPPAPPDARSAEPAHASVPGAPAPIPDRAAMAATSPPASADVESLIAAFVSSYEGGTIAVFANLFGDEAEANQQRGRIAIRGEYDQFFRATVWRRMNVARINWKPAGDRTVATGEMLVRIGWRDGREVEQRLGVDMELVQQGGRTVISKLSLQPR
jgi:hypothetical protein